MGAVLALVSAVSYGLSDFLGGLLSRRVSFVRVAFLGQLGGLVSLVAAALVSAAPPAVTDLGWGALSGVGTGVAMVFLFRGMSRGAMSIVVPISAVGGVALPVLVGVAVLGDRPSWPVWAGIVLIVPALWAVSRGPATSRMTSTAVSDGMLASVGIAVQYLALARAGPSAGIWPVASGRVSSVLIVALLAVVLAPRPGPAAAGTALRGRTASCAAGAGALAALALFCYLLATRTELVTVAVVLSSLYPAIPALLGITALKERLTRFQTAGLIGALTAGVAIAVA